MQYQVEVFEPRRQQTTRKIIHVKTEFAIWPHVVETARRLRDSSDARIRVRDEKGEVVVLTSAAAALLVSTEYDQSAA
jgi:hypothetical protein